MHLKGNTVSGSPQMPSNQTGIRQWFSSLVHDPQNPGPTTSPQFHSRPSPQVKNPGVILDSPRSFQSQIKSNHLYLCSLYYNQSCLSGLYRITGPDPNKQQLQGQIPLNRKKPQDQALMGGPAGPGGKKRGRTGRREKRHKSCKYIHSKKLSVAELWVSVGSGWG